MRQFHIFAALFVGSAVLTSCGGPTAAEEPASTQANVQSLTDNSAELRALLVQDDGRWKLVDGSEMFPDRDFVDQGVAFFTLDERVDGMIFYIEGCGGPHQYLHWNGNQATVGQNDTNIALDQAQVRCDEPPALPNQSPQIGYTFNFSHIGDNQIRVVYSDAQGGEQWTATYEQTPNHLLTGE